MQVGTVKKYRLGFEEVTCRLAPLNVTKYELTYQ
jgi:hypothetical protein